MVQPLPVLLFQSHLPAEQVKQVAESRWEAHLLFPLLVPKTWTASLMWLSEDLPSPGSVKTLFH